MSNRGPFSYGQNAVGVARRGAGRLTPRRG